MAPTGDTTKQSVSALTQLLTALDLDPGLQEKVTLRQPEISRNSITNTQAHCSGGSENEKTTQDCHHSFFSAAQALASHNLKPLSAPGRPSGYAQRLIRRGQAKAAITRLRSQRPTPRQPPAQPPSTNMPGESVYGLDPMI